MLLQSGERKGKAACQAQAGFSEEREDKAIREVSWENSDWMGTRETKCCKLPYNGDLWERLIEKNAVLYSIKSKNV